MRDKIVFPAIEGKELKNPLKRHFFVFFILTKAHFDDGRRSTTEINQRASSARNSNYSNDEGQLQGHQLLRELLYDARREQQPRRKQLSLLEPERKLLLFQ